MIETARSIACKASPAFDTRECFQRYGDYRDDKQVKQDENADSAAAKASYF